MRIKTRLQSICIIPLVLLLPTVTSILPKNFNVEKIDIGVAVIEETKPDIEAELATELYPTAEYTTDYSDALIVSSEIYPLSEPVVAINIESEQSEQEEAAVKTSQPQYFEKHNISLTDDEIYALATLVFLEGGAESYDCQRAICGVILNRMVLTDSSLYDVIYAPNQFTPAELIPYKQPSKESLQAVKDVLYNGSIIPKYVTYFRADYYFDWCIPYICYDQTYFSYSEKYKTISEDQ